jgi:ABC-type multidrug transport system fused ATPase/permease subunit
MAVEDPPILVLLVCVGIAYHRLQTFYRQSSRELRRLDSIHRSPVYTLFSECMESAVGIRALPTATYLYFDAQLESQLDTSLRVSLYLDVASQWQGVRLQLLGALITTFLAGSILLSALYSLLPMNASYAGLSLIYSFTIVNNLSGFLNALAETEQEMVSVERVLEYAALPSEFEGDDDGRKEDVDGSGGLGGGGGLKRITSAGSGSGGTGTDDGTDADRDNRENRGTGCAGCGCCGCCGFGLCPGCPGRSRQHQHHYAALQGSPLTSVLIDEAEEEAPARTFRVLTTSTFASNLPSAWAPAPTRPMQMQMQGILLSGVCMRYPGCAGDALRDLNLFLSAGSRVAVVGRTGSGKSSLLRLLLRLTDYTGSVSLSGRELRHISKRSLRCGLIVIPQKPVVFSGTVRTNLDPLGLHSEEELLEVLGKSRLGQTLGTCEGVAGVGGEGVAGMGTVMGVGMSGAVSLLDLELREGGANLSLGQQQLLCLARVLLRRADLVLVDELAAAVDAATQELLLDALDQHVKSSGATLLMVCHKLQGVGRICNKVST